MIIITEKTKDLFMKNRYTILYLLLIHSNTLPLSNSQEIAIFRATCQLTSQCLSNQPSHRKITPDNLDQLMPKALHKNIELTLSNARLNQPTESQQKTFNALQKKLMRYLAVLNQYITALNTDSHAQPK